MKKLLMAIVLMPLMALASSLNKEGYWSTNVKVSHGQEHTFWITGLTSSSTMSTWISGGYSYEEDGKTCEGEIYATKHCNVENAMGGFDQYVLLTAEDWDEVPNSVSSVTFRVEVEGFYDEETESNNVFSFGHASGRTSFPGDAGLDDYDPDAYNTEAYNTEVIAGVAWRYQIVDGKSVVLGVESTSRKLTVPNILGGQVVDSIGKMAFKNKTTIKAIDLPVSVTSIEDEAFAGCTALLSITIPENVERIGNRVFWGCSELRAVVFNGATLPWLGKQCFYGCNYGYVDESGYRFCLCTIYYYDEYYEVPYYQDWVEDWPYAGCGDLCVGEIVFDGDVDKESTSREYVKLESCNRGYGPYVYNDGDYVWSYYSFNECAQLGNDQSIIFCCGLLGPGHTSGLLDCDPVGVVEIPANMNGKMVEVIGEGAFGGLASNSGLNFKYNKITSIIIPRGVRTIQSGAFDGCAGSVIVKVPDSVSGIDQDAFAAPSVAEVKVDAANRTFTVMNGVVASKDGSRLVAAPGGLTSVIIPSSVSSIGSGTFSGCRSLASISVASGNSAYKSEGNCLLSKDGRTLVRGPAGKSVRIPPGVKFIDDFAFSGCEGIVSVEFPDGVISIGDSAFEGCSELMSVILPAGMTDVGKAAFRGCSGLKSLTIKEGVRSIGDSAFEGCRSLRSVTLPSSVTSMGDSVFRECMGLVSMAIPYGVTSVGRRAFEGCSGLMSLTIPCGVTRIGEYAFSRCHQLMSMTVPSSVTNLGVYAFSICSSLTWVAIPSSVLDFGYDGGRSLILGCPKMKTVYVDRGDEERVGIRLKSTADIVAADRCSVVFYAMNGLSTWTLIEVLQGHSIGDLPTAVWGGYTFDGWYTEIGAGTRVTTETIVEEDASYYAHWQMTGWRVVPGEKVEIDTGLVGCTASGFPTGLTYNRTTGVITGTATKPGEYAVKFTKSGAETEEMTIVVTAVPKITVEMAGVNAQSDTNGCKVTGAGEYLVGKTVTLKATVPAGTMFMGWAAREDTSSTDGAAAEDGGSTGAIVSEDATYSFTMGKEDVALVAKFKKEVMTVGCSWLSGGTFTAGVAASAAGIPLEIVTESGIRSVSVSKLPSGMAYDSRSRLITGLPNKAGTYNVEIAVTANSGSVEKRTIPVTVAALPAWAVGTFEGTVRCADGTHGTASFAVSAAGAISSGKIVEHGQSWTFTAKSYATTSVTRGLEQDYVILADAKCGTVTRQVELHVMGCAVEGVAESAAFAAGFFGDAELELWRNVWKDADAKGILAGIAGKYTYFFADDTPLPLDLKATAALSGKANIRNRDNASVSFSTTVFASSNGVEAAFYVAPDARKGYEEIYERFTLVPESGEKELGKAHRAPGVVAVPEPYVSPEGKADTGMGTATVSPAGGQVDAGKTVTVSATPDSKSVFVKWRYAIDGETNFCETAKMTFTMDGEHDVKAWAIFRSKESFVEPVVAVETSEQAKFRALELGVQFSAFVTVEDVENMKPVKWSAANLPSGLKINAETGEISGVATAVNSKPVVITATSVADSKKKTTFTLDIGAQDGKPAALPETAVGTFTGFVNNGTDNLGTFTFTSSDKGALSAKVIDATGTVSFSGSGFARSEDRKYGVELKTTKGETLTLTLDSGAGWDKDQLTGGYSFANGRALAVSAQRNAFSKAWYFAAVGDETAGWTFTFEKDAKAAALTVTLKADGTTSIAGKFPNGVDKNGKAVTLSVSASGVANVGMMREGAMSADFAPVLTVNKVKKVLAIRTNLWFDRKNDHESGVGEAKFVE